MSGIRTLGNLIDEVAELTPSLSARFRISVSLTASNQCERISENFKVCQRWGF